MMPFVAAMAVERSDFEIALEEGTIRCAAKVGGNSLVRRGAFVDERVACRWRVPKNVSGKRLAGALRSRSTALPPSAVLGRAR